MILDIDTVTDEFWAMLARMNYTLEPRHMAHQLTLRLRKAFQEQIDEAMASQGEPGGRSWDALSPWRIAERGNARPILVDTGEFFDTEVKRYRGTVRLISAGFSFHFPDTREMSGQAWGLMGGQLINPLGAAPLALTPRRVLGGNQRQMTDSIQALITYFRSEGWEVEIG